MLSDQPPSLPKKPPKSHFEQLVHVNFSATPLAKTAQLLAQTFPLPRRVHNKKGPSEVKQKSDLYSSLQINETEKAAIHDIITTLAKTGLLKLAFKRSYLRNKSRALTNLHTLKFLECVLTTPELKADLRQVRESSLKWNGFLWAGDEGGTDGTAGALNTCANEGSLNSYLPGFAQVLNVDLAKLQSFADARDWEGFLDLLLSK
jgi:hypothetical protein